MKTSGGRECLNDGIGTCPLNDVMGEFRMHGVSNNGR